MRVTKCDNILTITNEDNSIDIPIDDVIALESKIHCYNRALSTFSYQISVSHELKVVTKSHTLSFLYPAPWYSYYKTNYDEVFKLIDMDIPNYKCTLLGNIKHINKDIEYYIEYKKRLPFVTRIYLYFIDLPLPMKFLYLLMIFTLCFSLFCGVIFWQLGANNCAPLSNLMSNINL